MDKMWYIYTMEYYSAIKGNGIGSFVEMWIGLESVIQSEVNQKERHKHPVCMESRKAARMSLFEAQK